MVEPPQELEEFTISPLERFRVDHSATIPSEEASRVTEKGDRKRKYTKLGMMEGSCIGDQLTTSLVSTSGPTDVAGYVIWIDLQCLDFHKRVIFLRFVFYPQFNNSPIKLCWWFYVRVRDAGV